MYRLAVILVVVSTDYGRKQILFHWITVILRIMNLVSESLKSIFFIEGERALGWCFLHMSALKSSWQKSKLQAVIPLPLVTNQFFVIFTKKVKFGYFFPLHGLFPPPDMARTHISIIAEACLWPPDFVSVKSHCAPPSPPSKKTSGTSKHRRKRPLSFSPKFIGAIEDGGA